MNRAGVSYSITGDCVSYSIAVVGAENEAVAASVAAARSRAKLMVWVAAAVVDVRCLEV